MEHGGTFDLKLKYNYSAEMRQNSSSRLCYDYVEVRNGNSPYSDQVGVFCGTTAPPDILASGPRLWVKFFSDSVNNSPGR